MNQQPATHSPFNGLLLQTPYLRLDDWRRPIHAWHFNPWTGHRRDPGDVGTDPHGLAIYEKAWGPMRASARDPSTPSPPALARQEGGQHYKDLKIQPFEYIHANSIPFAEGSVIKYVTRWRAKGGVADLKKARHFLDLLIEAEDGQHGKL